MVIVHLYQSTSELKLFLTQCSVSGEILYFISYHFSKLPYCLTKLYYTKELITKFESQGKFMVTFS